jgi:hypothetical protein
LEVEAVGQRIAWKKIDWKKWALLAMVPLLLGASLVPNSGRIQGRLFDDQGYPLAGPVEISLAVYGGSEGGAALYQEEHTGVVLSEGSFVVVLGEGTTVVAGTHDPSLYAGASERWIEVSVDDEVLTPRQRIHAVPYAMVAEQAATAPFDASTVEGNFAVTGQVIWGGTGILNTGQGGSIELGDSGSAASTPYIDFHFGESDEDVDHNTRLINDSDHVLSMQFGDFHVDHGKVQSSKGFESTGGQIPDDIWSDTATWLQGNLGSLGTQGNYAVSLAQNGYRWAPSTQGCGNVDTCGFTLMGVGNTPSSVMNILDLDDGGFHFFSEDYGVGDGVFPRTEVGRPQRRMFIEPGGQVGIGVTTDLAAWANPTALLNVGGDAVIGGSLEADTLNVNGSNTDSTEGLIVTANGMILQDVANNIAYDIWIQGKKEFPFSAAGIGGDSRNLAILGEAGADLLRFNWNNEYKNGTKIDGNVHVSAAPEHGAPDDLSPAAPGNLTVDGDLAVGGTITGTIAAGTIAMGSIGQAEIEEEGVSFPQIKDGSVRSEELAANLVTKGYFSIGSYDGGADEASSLISRDNMLMVWNHALVVGDFADGAGPKTGGNFESLGNDDLLVAGDIFFPFGALVASEGASAHNSNWDHIWHDDGTNTWHFVSDWTYKAGGNSRIQVAAVVTNEIDGGGAPVEVTGDLEVSGSITGVGSVPIGTVIDWWRPNANFPIPEGFQICDGSLISNSKSPMQGHNTPSLDNRVVVGSVDPNASAASGGMGTGGKYTHNHTAIYFDGPNKRYKGWTESGGVQYYSDWGDGMDDDGVGKYPLTINSTATIYTANQGDSNGDGAMEDPDTFPPYRKLLKLIRIY